jgi:hypothetical protein
VYVTAVGRVGSVIAPFADALSAEEHALDSQFGSYDGCPRPGSAVSRPSPRRPGLAPSS